MLSLQQPNLIEALTAANGTSFAGATQGRPFFTVLDSDMVHPYSHQYNFSWERELRGSWHVQLGYCREPYVQDDHDAIHQPRADWAGNRR